LSEEQWRDVLKLAEEVADLPSHERKAFLESSQAGPEIAREALALANEFTAAAPPHAAGMQIGRFVITGSLGHGGMGEVFSAQDTELNRSVALKFLTPDTTLLPEAIQNFIHEAQTASALNHPNIVTVHEVMRSESRIAIVMELVEGKSLRELCGSPLPVSQIIDIGGQIARGLAAAHARGIVHRDIKPENILVRADGCVKVLDFGLARQAPKDGHSSNLTLPAGTLRYLSPEQARTERASSASDIFSFGLVLYELATSKHAFPADSPLETAHAILTREPSGPLPPNLPESLQRLIGSMLSKSPAARPTAEQVVHQLGAIQRTIESPSRQASHVHTLSPRQRFWLGALAASLAISAVFIWSARGKRDGQELVDLTIKPLTSQSGWEAAPALSPDGESIAFTWSPRLDIPKQIYLMRLTDTEPVKLTGSSSGAIGYLAWSPDGKRIAFKRLFDERGALYSIGTSGGDEQNLLELADANLSSAIDWSPDGNQLAFADSLPGGDQLVIYLYDLRTAEKRRLTSPPKDVWGDWDPKFSPDGRTIAFKRVAGFWTDNIYLVPSTGGPLRQITSTGRGIWGQAWMPDGQSLLVSCQWHGTVFGIWRFPLNGSSTPERVAQGGVDSIMPATGRHTPRMAWVNQLWDLNIYRIPSSGTGKPVKLIASTQRDQCPVYSPDGRIAWISDRSGTREVWMSGEDASNQVQITNLNGRPIDHLRWSYDGQHLAFDTQPLHHPRIFILECPPRGLQCGAPKPLNDLPARSPGWSADSKSVYFGSNQTGKWQLWRQALSGGKPVQIAGTEGVSYAYESPDGKWLYFSDGHDDSTINRVPGSQAAVPSDSKTFVLGRPYKVQREGWAVTSNEIVFIDRPTLDRPAAIRAYNVVTGKVRSILDLNEVFLDRGDIGVSVSADGKSILYAQLDRSGSNVIIAERNR
jgi:serine/threonine protein kinase